MVKTEEFLCYPQRTEAEKEGTRLAYPDGISIYQAKFPGIGEAAIHEIRLYREKYLFGAELLPPA